MKNTQSMAKPFVTYEERKELFEEMKVTQRLNDHGKIKAKIPYIGFRSGISRTR